VVGTWFIILGTVVVISTTLVLPLTSLDTAQSDSVTLPAVQDTIAGVCSESVASLLKEAGNEIADDDIADYYQQMCDEYGLYENTTAVALQEPPAATDIIPIEDINRIALSSMLEGAGSNIHDTEIAEFYYQFLDKAGLRIEPKE
jgi:hypothetical protein